MTAMQRMQLQFDSIRGGGQAEAIEGMVREYKDQLKAHRSQASRSQASRSLDSRDSRDSRDSCDSCDSRAAAPTAAAPAALQDSTRERSFREISSASERAGHSAHGCRAGE